MKRCVSQFILNIYTNSLAEKVSNHVDLPEVSSNMKRSVSCSGLIVTFSSRVNLEHRQFNSIYIFINTKSILVSSGKRFDIMLQKCHISCRYPFPKYHFLPSIQCKLYTYFYAIYLDLVTNKPNKISSLSALHVSWNYGKYFY